MDRQLRAALVPVAVASIAIGACGVDTAPRFPNFGAVDTWGGVDALADPDPDTGGADGVVVDSPASDPEPDDAALDSEGDDPRDDGADGDGALDAPADVADPGAHPDLVVASFNVARYFDTTCATGDCSGDAYEALPSDAQFRYRTSQLVAAIDRLDADVVILQEIETMACLDALVAELGAARYPTALLGETGAPASVDVAVLARSPDLLRVDTHVDDVLFRPDGSRTSFARALVEVHLGLPRGRLIVFGAHFKAKSDDDPGRRFAEAHAAGTLAREAAAAFPEAIVLVAGDLNDTPGSAPLNALEGDDALVRAGALLPDGSDWTHALGATRSAIDHIYLVVDAAGRFVPGSVEIVRDASGGLAGSDHAAVRAGVDW